MPTGWSVLSTTHLGRETDIPSVLWGKSMKWVKMVGGNSETYTIQVNGFTVATLVVSDTKQCYEGVVTPFTLAERYEVFGSTLESLCKDAASTISGYLLGLSRECDNL